MHLTKPTAPGFYAGHTFRMGRPPKGAPTCARYFDGFWWSAPVDLRDIHDESRREKARATPAEFRPRVFQFGWIKQINPAQYGQFSGENQCTPKPSPLVA